MARPTSKKSRLHVGSRVTFMFGVTEVVGTVVEDRGPVGMGGRRLLRVRLEVPAAEPVELEIPAEDVKVAA